MGVQVGLRGEASRWPTACHGKGLDLVSGVARGSVHEAEQWPWSSYRGYAFGEEGTVRINQWGEAKMKIPTPAA